MARILRGIINTNGFLVYEHTHFLEETAQNYRKMIYEKSPFEFEQWRQSLIINYSSEPRILNTLRSLNEIIRFAKARILPGLEV